jgi:hypothetical protein
MDVSAKDESTMITPQFDSSLLEHKTYTYQHKFFVNQTELDAIEKLHSVGIFAQPGRVTHYKYADVVAWGCVLIEIRTANISKVGTYRWRIKAARIADDVIRGHLMMLVYIDHLGDKHHHLFPVWHDVFYNADGSMKKGMNYTPGKMSDTHAKYGLSMGDDLMFAHKDRWDLIENARQHIGSSYSIESIRRALKAA